jgi:hypothetical protein
MNGFLLLTACSDASRFGMRAWIGMAEQSTPGLVASILGPQNPPLTLSRCRFDGDDASLFCTWNASYGVDDCKFLTSANLDANTWCIPEDEGASFCDIRFGCLVSHDKDDSLFFGKSIL